MLAEEKALLVPGLEEFGRSEREANGEASREVPVCARDAGLIKRLKVGEIDAFDELVAEFQPLVYALSLRVLGEPEDARDACQETFLKVFRHFGRFRGEASLKTWICRIAINQARSTERWWRRRYKQETTSLDEPAAAGDEGRSAYESLASPGVSPEAEAMAHERSARLERALAQVKKDFRIAVILRDLEGMTYEEIAYTLDISVGTVKSRIARGREMLRVSMRNSGS
ncbi:MAG: sigma-70 family RNA polymerase sigma factor, partial [Acidobacteriota bacterium]